MSANPVQLVDVTVARLGDLNRIDTSQLEFDSEFDRQEFERAYTAAQRLRADGIVNDNFLVFIPTPLNSRDLDLTTRHLGRAAELTPNVINDFWFNLVALVLEVWEELRKVSRLDRLELDQRQLNLLQAAADKLRAAKTFVIAAAAVSGIASILSGAVAAFGAMRAGYTAMGKGPPPQTVAVKIQARNADALGKGGRMEWVKHRQDQIKLAFKNLPHKAKALGHRMLSTNLSAHAHKLGGEGAAQLSFVQNAKYQALTQLLQGLGQLIEGILNGEKIDVEAAQKDLEALATKVGSERALRDEFYQLAHGLIQAALGFTKDVGETHLETERRSIETNAG